MGIEVEDWVLVDGKDIAWVHTLNHWGDKGSTLVYSTPDRPRLVDINWLTKLDPVLYPFLWSEYDLSERKPR